MVNIGFWFDYDQTFTFVKVSKKLMETFDIKVSGILINDRYEQYAKEVIYSDKALFKLYDHIEIAKTIELEKNNKLLDKFHYYDKKYKLSHITYSDRHIDKLNYKEVKQIIIYLIDEYTKYIERENLDLFVFNCIASMYSHLLYIVLIENDIEVKLPSTTSLENRWYWANNPYEKFYDAYETYYKLKSGHVQSSNKIQKHAKKIFNSIREYKPAYHDKAVVLEKNRYSLPSIQRVLKYFYNYFKYYKNDYTQPSPFQRLKEIIINRKNLALSNKYFSSIDAEKEKYIFFPLHYEPEIATLILAQYNQLSIIDILAKQLPLEWKLVVKEHPAMVGQRDINFYEKIVSNYPNVILVYPDINARYLIDKSEIVFSLSGTAIFEAIVLEKPVVYTGMVRYEGFNLGIHYRDILDFDKIIDKALEYKYNIDDIIYMIEAMLMESYDFIFAEPLGTPEVLNDDNIEYLTKSLIERSNILSKNKGNK